MPDGNHLRFSNYEEEMLTVWQREKTFQQSLKQRRGKPYFGMYDGPPFANGLPHYGHVVPSTIKDAIGRYKTMRGYYVPRRAGWDTHGLPVEYEVEKQLGIAGKRQILDIGVDKFNNYCRESVFKYKDQFEHFINRLGRWLDLEHAYATLDDDYIESVWWVLSELYKKGLVYQGFRSMPYCPRCATPLSNFELNQGYQDNIVDPSVYVAFPLKEDMTTGLLAWTTTPWTLPANAALAVQPKADYVTLELNTPGDIKLRHLIVAKSRLSELAMQRKDYKVVKQQKGADLLGVSYKPLYRPERLKDEEKDSAYKVYADKHVSLEEGTGILHVAPCYGETDLELGQKEGLPLLRSVDDNGDIITPNQEFTGMFFKDADLHVIADLTHRGLIFAAEKIKHTYPFCWRCDTPLFYNAMPSWFVAVSGLVDKLVYNNQQINWVPSHIKEGRFGNWLAEARDWGISRNRFWGAPIPIWRCDNHHITVIGSIDELKQRASNPDKIDNLHRPEIDTVKIRCDKCNQEATRIEEVFDCWFESGAMPYAQDHYPFENQKHFSDGFPADFISEGLDQTRGWFYTLHVLATGLYNSPAYKNVVCHGIVVAADGKKLSKRLKNYPPLEEVFDAYGADCLRFFMLNSSVVVGENVRFGADLLKDVQRNVFMTWWNIYIFYKTYTEIDNWRPKSIEQPRVNNVLDDWILSRLNQTLQEVTKQADYYRLDKATQPLKSFIDDLSNWYIRRSRRRFWKSENDQDKNEAYETLFFVLLRLCQLMAPWAPFLSEKIYRDLTSTKKDDLPSSVHLCDWPKANIVKDEVIHTMKRVRLFINEGLAQRALAKIKVRQPLQSVQLSVDIAKEFQEIILEELNVKQLIIAEQQKNVGRRDDHNESVKVDIKITPDLYIEGLMRELVRHIQNTRKQANLNIEDRIILSVVSKNRDIHKVLTSHATTIKNETLATSINLKKPTGYRAEVLIDGAPVEIVLKKNT